MTKIQHLSVAESLKSLHAHPEGLSIAESERRRQEFGPNQVQCLPRTPWTLRFLKGFTHFFALILWVAALLCFFAEREDPGEGMATLGVAILGVIVINALFSFWQEFRAEQAMAALQKLLPQLATVVREGSLHCIPADDLVPGDILLFEAGDNVSADCRVIESRSLRVNNATVTGESVPQDRDATPCDGDDLLQCRNMLLTGSSVVAGRARAVVFATGMRTEFGKIAHLTQTPRESLSPLQTEIARLSRIVAIVAAALGATFFAIGVVSGMNFWTNLLFVIGIVVANVPEGLLPTVTLALAMGAQRMAKKNALIRHLPSVETLGSATVICTDKTGTLTQNRMAVKRLYLGGAMHDPFGVSSLTLPEHHAFFQAAFYCHDLKETEENGGRTRTGDPLEIALVEMAERRLPDGDSGYPRVDELPFDSERRRLSVVHRTSAGLMLYSKGALETLLPRCSRVWTGGRLTPLAAPATAAWLQAQEAMATDGLRVLAVAQRLLPPGADLQDWEEELTLLGLVGLEDPPRPETAGAVARCHQAGIKIVMATGDHPCTALAVARQIGLVCGDRPTIVTGDQLRRMSLTQLQLTLSLPEVHFARVSADQKMRLVQALKAKGHVVAVTGDGVNDAPALRQADIGIAMGRTGADVARAAADMILLDDNFASIVAAIEEGRAVFANIRKFLAYILTSNVPELIPYLAFVLFKVPLALTVVQILAVDLGTDIAPALALGAELPEKNIMREPPRSATKRLVDWGLLLRAYLWLGAMEAIAALSAFFFVLESGGWRMGQTLPPSDPLYRSATAACLSVIVVMQVVNVFVCCSETDSVFSRRWYGNRLIWAGIAIELAIIAWIDYTAAGNLLFGTGPVGAAVWLLSLPLAAAMLLLEELRKRWVRIRRVCGRPAGALAETGALPRCSPSAIAALRDGQGSRLDSRTE